jgi:hypothetical protein
MIKVDVCLPVTARIHQEVKTEALNFRSTFRTIMKSAIRDIIRICRRESGQSIHGVASHRING